MSDELKMDVQEDNDEILEILQEAVNAETTSRNLYWSRWHYWREKGFKNLGHYYKEQAEEKHAQRVERRCLALSGMPSLTPAHTIAVGGSITEQFNEDLEVESALAESYREWITRASELKDFVTEDLLRKSLKETEKHVRWLQKQINRINEIGEENYLQTWI
jgi:bacterioferritin